MKVAVTVVDSDCQDAMLAHGTTTISVDRQTTPQSHNHMSQKDNPLMCSLIRKSKVRGALASMRNVHHVFNTNLCQWSSGVKTRTNTNEAATRCLRPGYP